MTGCGSKPEVVEMPVVIDIDSCNSCRICHEICPLDVIGWDDKLDVPVVLYPDECWYCGCCYFDCPEGAIDITLPPVMM